MSPETQQLTSKALSDSAENLAVHGEDEMAAGETSGLHRPGNVRLPRLYQDVFASALRRSGRKAKNLASAGFFVSTS